VIATAYRPCPEPLDTLLRTSQSQLEGVGSTSDLAAAVAGGGGGGIGGGRLTFLGLLSLSSRLKDDTCPTVAHLKAADIHVNMITGDHIHTAIAVAKDCGIVPSVDSPYLSDPAVQKTPESREFCSAASLFSAFYLHTEGGSNSSSGSGTATPSSSSSSSSGGMARKGARSWRRGGAAGDNEERKEGAGADIGDDDDYDDDGV
jgi:magnesium-transporting ATPase (P-type)